MTKNYASGIASIALLQGGYMLFDGIHKLRAGTYFGGQIGPWGHIVAATGISTDSMPPVFILSGSLWLAGAIGLLLGAIWSKFR